MDGIVTRTWWDKFVDSAPRRARATVWYDNAIREREKEDDET